MNGAVTTQAIGSFEAAPAHAISELALARMGAEGGATRADIVKGMRPLASHRLSPSELRRAVETGLELLMAGRLASDTRGRFQLTEAGTAMLAELFGATKLPPTWAEIRDVRLVARALGVEAQARRLKTLARPDGLRAMILQRHYDIVPNRVISASRLRMGLAVIALERAFGNKIKSGLDAGKGLSVKASRLLAGQLAQRPRDFGTDTRLIAALAAEAVGAVQIDPASLRQAVLRNYVSRLLGAGPGPSAAGTVATPDLGPDQAAVSGARAGAAAGGDGVTSHRPAAPAGGDAAGPGGLSRSRPAAANRPDLAGFAAIVLAHALANAEGWPGNRKAFISRVWRGVAEEYAAWGLSEIEFKSMLAEAHRTGHVVLSSADIKSKASLAEVQASAIAYKNTVWHFIRVED